MNLFAEEKASTLKLLKLLFKNKWLIIIFTLIGVATSVVVTYFIPKKYTSFAIVFPANSNLGLSLLEDPRFGNSLDADQLMQLLESKQLLDTIVQKYNLVEYYDIDETSRTSGKNLQDKFYRDVTFSKTRYYSVVITATFKDPELAANIVNSIVEIVDDIRIKIIRENQSLSYDYAKEQYENQQELVDAMKKVIYSKKDTSNSSGVLYNHLVELTKTSAESGSRYVETPEMEDLVEKYVYESEKLKNLKGDYDKAQRLIQKPLSKVFVVTKAVPIYKKVSPSYLINSLIGLSASMLFIILILIVRDRLGYVINALKS